MIFDPGYDEMMDYLLGLYGIDAADEAEIAIHRFAENYHGGPGTKLYNAARMARYRPGLDFTAPMSEYVFAMHRDLCERFKVPTLDDYKSDQ